MLLNQVWEGEGGPNISIQFFELSLCNGHGT